MRIAMISPEIGPFAKSGGLADVVQTLSLALGRQGHELILIMPAYRMVLKGDFSLAETDQQLSVPIGERIQRASIFRGRLGKDIPVYFVREDRYFDRDFLYATPAGDYPDNAERFVFFSRAALEILRTQPVQIIHCHDWQSALAVVYCKAQMLLYPELRAAKTVFTVHNLGFQGLFAESEWDLLNLDRSLFTPSYLEFYGRINFLKGSLVFADKITTVSPTYAEEITTAELGFGLEGVLRERYRDLVGVLNGVDYGQWSPENDRFIRKNYNRDDLSGKRACKQDLQQALGLPPKPAVPVIGMISRLTSQKGFDLVEAVLEKILDRDLQWVVLGTGERRYEDLFTRLAGRFPEKVAAKIGFDEPLAHRIEAGADIFLMPSLYEPCGLNQIFSLRYGTIPVVRATGGLKDTVEDHDPAHRTGTGFVFGPYEPAALLEALERALAAFTQQKDWPGLMRRAMSKDFSWERSARSYAGLYQTLVSR